jgi:RNA polymerase sigma factor (sigma-70 family)
LQTLAAQLKTGSSAAFKELVAAYGRQVLNTAISFVQHKETAEDITQETFAEVYGSIDKFNEQAELGTWIYRIAVNKCLDHLRYTKRRKRFAFVSGLLGGEEQLPDTSNFCHPGIAAEQKEQARLLYAAIDTLSNTQRIAFILVYIEDMAQKDVADIMKLNIKAVESLLQRAKANLRKKLGDVYDARRKYYK